MFIVFLKDQFMTISVAGSTGQSSIFCLVCLFLLTRCSSNWGFTVVPKESESPVLNLLSAHVKCARMAFMVMYVAQGVTSQEKLALTINFHRQWQTQLSNSFVI